MGTRSSRFVTDSGACAMGGIGGTLDEENEVACRYTPDGAARGLSNLPSVVEQSEDVAYRGAWNDRG